MPAFDAGAFSAAFDAEAPDITSSASRAVLEVLAELGQPTIVHRAVVEALAEAEGSRVSRVVTEVVAEYIPELGRVHRSLLEVIRPDTYTLPSWTNRVDRVAAEVIAWAIPPGPRPRVLRSAAEVITTLESHRGLGLPNVAVDVFSGYLAFTPDLTQDGSLGLLTGLGEGLLIRWDAGATELTLNWRQGPNNVTWAQTIVPGAQVVHYAADTPGLVLAELGLTRPEGYTGPVTVHEVLVLDDPTPAAELRVQRYLEGRWQGTGAEDPCQLYGVGAQMTRTVVELIREHTTPTPGSGWTITPVVTSEGVIFIAPEYAALIGQEPLGSSEPPFTLAEGGVVVLQFIPSFPVYSLAFFTPDVGRTGAVVSVDVGGVPAVVDTLSIQDAGAAGLPWAGTLAVVGLSGVPPVAEGEQIIADITWT